MKLDPAASYVTTVGARYRGHDLAANYPVKIVEEPARPGELTEDEAQQLLDARKLMLAHDVRPTPIERPEDEVERLAEIEAMEDGKFLIRAPWLDGGSETVTGDDAARERFSAIKAEGLDKYRAAKDSAAKSGLSDANAGAVGSATITGSDGFGIVESGSNGYFEVLAPGREPEKVRGKANAEARLAELRTEAATPPVVVEAETDEGEA